ncbi:hypothetical protein AA103196_1579 [Ameyamaea chiangmaiensis NBRC 103196]|uniref:Type VI secretion system-associated protein TagF n=1 Tax=Ameyamaea chiangmaiensis TaxID=442969 RepID=A0A850PC29_9PROT|nr:type VI secretion system-associated protein TagF [Ameyamaea chiangmaiensis]MBS4076104.1 type VI secretion system-associated protein TagF [Ameyamaea chiangmaiensis]NVN41674.1 type VI secretion system-associated protein TagF [Ameyamaea chiangmaiensis]GBQ67032.1 hypothetical protein AA103196_1579 [Ameyamaea chiangmaiensis NBRC 103196]
MIEPYAGYWGKLPAHGDFVRGGLSDGIVSRLDRWVSVEMAAAHARHGERFERLWHRAPTWSFTIRPGVLEHGHAVTGLWTPSIDAAGRCFPFIFTILHDPARAFYRGLAPFDATIRTAIQTTQPLEALEVALEAAGRHPIPSAAPVHDVWWRVGQADGGTIHGALPVADAFDWLIEGRPQGDSDTTTPAASDAEGAADRRVE